MGIELSGGGDPDWREGIKALLIGVIIGTVLYRVGLLLVLA